MKTTIYDLREENANKNPLNTLLKYYGEDTTVYEAQQTAIMDCIGCWSCWWKTPGKCALKDNTSGLYGDFIVSEHVVLLFQISNGFISGKGKTFLDRLIQHYLPYIKIRNGECNHLKRYDNYPAISVHFDEADMTIEEINLVKAYLARMAYHFYGACRLVTINGKEVYFTELLPNAPKCELSQPQEIRRASGKWIIYNGSPRRKTSNSKILIEQMLIGMKSGGVEEVIVRELADQKMHDLWIEEFSEYDNHLFVFPLYVHAMPGVVMKFIEKLRVYNNSNIHMAFFIQSGFPETSQSYYIRPYFSLLAKRLGVSFDGVMVKAGVEGMQLNSQEKNKKLFGQMQQFGRTYAKEGIMDKQLLEEYSKSDYLSKNVQRIFSFLSLFGITNMYWDMNLKKNNAYGKRFDRPYLD